MNISFKILFLHKTKKVTHNLSYDMVYFFDLYKINLERQIK